MKILVTGSCGFVGRNLVAALNNIKDGKDRTRPELKVDDVYCYDIDSAEESLDEYCKTADFVFNLAGVNRPKTDAEFMQGNFGFASRLLTTLEKHGNKSPVMLSSSVQATLAGRYANSEYGKSKLAGEELFFEYGEKNGVDVFVYRFPNLFGKWCKPDYNSAIATFCNNIANGLPITVNDENTELELLYIDDLVIAMLDLLENKASHCDYVDCKAIASARGKYCFVDKTYRVTLGEIVRMLNEFHEQPNTLMMPELRSDSFGKKLYSTYLSYLPKNKVAVPLRSNVDPRGSFTEILKTPHCGQFSVNVSKPSVTKGQHWHNSKWELFIVVSGRALIRERKIGTDEVWDFEVSGDRLEAVHMLPGYTHSIINLSDTDDLVTLMWANEVFDCDRPDTFFEKVE